MIGKISQESIQLIQSAIDVANDSDATEAKKILWPKALEKSVGPDAELINKTLFALDEEDPETANQYGIVLLNNNKYEQAAEMFNVALRKDPKHGRAWNNLGNVCKIRGQLKDAQTCYDRAESLLDDPKQKKTVAVNALYVMLARRLYEEALERALNLLETNPDSFSLHIALNEIYQKLKQPEKADEHCHRAIEIEPDNMTGYYEVARVHRLHNPDKAREYWRKAKQLVETGKSPKSISARDWSVFNMYLREPEFEDEFNGYVYQGISLDKFLGDSSQFENKQVGADSNDYLVTFKEINLGSETFEIWDDEFVFSNLTFHFKKGEKPWSFSYRDDEVLIRPYDEVIELDSPVGFLGGCENYYHWLLDYLPRIKIINQCPEFDGIPLLTNTNLKRYQLESLKLIGFNTEQLQPMKKDTVYHCQKLYLPHFKGRAMEDDSGMPDWFVPTIRPGVTDWLREQFKPYMKPHDDLPKRIFISRKDAPYRQCRNEDEIFEIAQQYGFEKIENEKFSFSDQIALYAGAEAVMGVHGAGFTNMLFAPEGTHVIELQSNGNLPDFYIMLAGVLNQHHSFIEGEITHLEPGVSRMMADFEVDPNDLKSELEKLGL